MELQRFLDRGARRRPHLPVDVKSIRAKIGELTLENEFSEGALTSMDGKGAWWDDVFVERLWRSVKYEEVYLRAYETVSEARKSIGRYLDFYNGRRPHSSLDGGTPDRV